MKKWSVSGTALNQVLTSRVCRVTLLPGPLWLGVVVPVMILTMSKENMFERTCLPV